MWVKVWDRSEEHGISTRKSRVMSATSTRVYKYLVWLLGAYDRHACERILVYGMKPRRLGSQLPLVTNCALITNVVWIWSGIAVLSPGPLIGWEQYNLYLQLRCRSGKRWKKVAMLAACLFRLLRTMTAYRKIRRSWPKTLRNDWLKKFLKHVIDTHAVDVNFITKGWVFWLKYVIDCVSCKVL